MDKVDINLILNSSHINFLFDEEDCFNIFNLVRLLPINAEGNEFSIDVCSLDKKFQISIVSRFAAFLNIYSAIRPNSQKYASLKYSKVDQKVIDVIDKKQDVLQDVKTLIFDINSNSYQKDPQDPHYVKNVRGAILLSLVQDLLSIGSLKKDYTIFDERSPILLHSASAFLNNEENAKMVWRILEAWDNGDKSKIRTELNSRINVSQKAQRGLGSSTIQFTRKLSDNITFSHLVSSLQGKINLPKSIYIDKDKINIWFVDDQQANGWYKLINGIIPNSHFDIIALNGKDDVNLLLQLTEKDSGFEVPDLALVDLRLTSCDQDREKYNAQDLSGFEVVDLLLNQWAGLSVMITSASSKLWNMEKAIEKGAVAYWRKSDEILSSETDSSVLTAFDIHVQFIEKLVGALSRVKYKYIFRIVAIIRENIKPFDTRYKFLQLSIENYFQDLVQKTSWMCWNKASETKTNDSLCLGVMEIFNEIENMLWNADTGDLNLVPNKKVQHRSENSDSQIINDTLDFMDKKYEITGLGLLCHYEKFKRIRNKLSTIHGSESAQDVKHAKIEDIEFSLLIIWSLLNELKINNK